MKCRRIFGAIHGGEFQRERKAVVGNEANRLTRHIRRLIRAKQNSLARLHICSVEPESIIPAKDLKVDRKFREH